MGIVKSALLLEKGLRADFMKAYNNGEDPADVMPLIMKTTSSSSSEKYGWLGEVPQMVEWKDERTLRGLGDFDYTLANKDYEATLKVDKNALEDDQLGAVKVRINDLAIKARTSFPRKLFFDQLVNGDTELCYDGVSFFSASHPESGTNQSNIVSGTSANPYTVATFSADFISARTKMRGFVDNQGEPRNEGEMDLLIVAPVGLEGVIDQVIGAGLINNNTNVLQGAAKKLVTGRLTGETWYLADMSGQIKPFIMQERSPLRFEAQDKGERAFMRKELLYGIDQRVGFGFGLWSKMVKISN